MLPCYKSNFGLPDLLKATISGYSTGVEDVEDAYAEAFGMPYAILLPSARAGICWTLRACSGKGQQVICPVFTCWEVWQAVRRVHSDICLVDLDKDSFLMDYNILASFQEGPHAMVLSQIYGYPYDLDALDMRSKHDPGVRIVDMAMGLPDQNLFKQLGPRDVALISFGARKCLYSGWGGMAFMRDRALADEVRRLRGSEQVPESFVTAGLKFNRMFMTELARLEIVHSAIQSSRRWWNKFQVKIPRNIAHPVCVEQHQDHPSFEAYYRVPPSGVNRNLMLYNLLTIEDQRKHRKSLAEHYTKNLSGIAGIILPPISCDAMSHYTIRVPATRRAEIVDMLSRSGFAVETLFAFSARLPIAEYPVSAKVADQVINLPLYLKFTPSEVERICSVLRKVIG